MNLSSMVNQALKAVKKHSPGILTGIGVTGFFIAAGMAVQETPKALKLIEKKKQELQVEKLTVKETVKTTWKCYIPSAITAITSAACIVGASSVSARRNAALATAYTISETAAREYRDKVVDAIGEKKEHAVRDAVAKEQIEKNPVSKSKVVVTGFGNTKCFDPWNSRYFDSDAERIRKGVNDLNYQLINEGCVSLNDFYYSIGLDESKTGEVLGWNINRDGQVQLRFSAQVDENNTPCLVLDFINPPQYGYSQY